ncbi:hypothetical protein GE09DRAFT_1285263 [Coniochaeta sp. 2T2.1]|nr:hypothetical protein GE09DRAFT_1285263 [Coniochaeta sp. 2T2.1]
MFQAYIGSPIYSAPRNHDTSQENLDVPHAIDENGPVGQQFPWNYDLISKLWELHGWIDAPAAKEASLHYGAYAITHPVHSNLRIITLTPTSGTTTTRTLSSMPQARDLRHVHRPDRRAAESRGQGAGRLDGSSGTFWRAGAGPTPCPTPPTSSTRSSGGPARTSSATSFGATPTKTGRLTYYSQNGTNQTAENAVASAWVGPSLAPLMKINSGYRFYEVGTGSWEVLEAYTFFSDVNSFSSLEGRDLPSSWSTLSVLRRAHRRHDDEPLNATFWHGVTEAMEKDRSLVRMFNTFQSKSSVLTPSCDSEACAIAKICYMRSGSQALWRQCPQGFDSTQSPYTGRYFRLLLYIGRI